MVASIWKDRLVSASPIAQRCRKLRSQPLAEQWGAGLCLVGAFCSRSDMRGTEGTPLVCGMGRQLTCGAESLEW